MVYVGNKHSGRQVLFRRAWLNSRRSPVANHAAMGRSLTMGCTPTRCGDKGSGTARAEDAQGTPTQSHVSPSILVYEDNLKRFQDFCHENGSSQGRNTALTGFFVPSSLDSGTGAVSRWWRVAMGATRPHRQPRCQLWAVWSEPQNARNSNLRILKHSR